MASCRRINAVAICLVVVIELHQVAPLPASREDSEEDMLSHIQREHNLIKKAKYEIRLARLKLLHGSDACEKDDHEACAKLMSEFLDMIRNSWNDLQSSGRDAVKQPSGFRELDIALREDSHTLEDLKVRLPVEDRSNLAPVVQEAERIHNEVFSALFPSASPRAKKSQRAPQETPGKVE